MSQQEQAYEKAVALIDAANGADPNQAADADGNVWPKELLYSQRMTDMQQRYAPDADDVMKLAIRAQHIERWKSPRSDYPEGRQGYLKWRTDLYKFHADTTGRLMAEAGYPEDDIERQVAEERRQDGPDLLDESAQLE